MAWFRCIGGESPLSTVIIKNAKISDKTDETYIYPTYSDISNYDCVVIKIYTTVNGIYYENYVSADCNRLPELFSSLILYDTINNTTWNQSLSFVVNSTRISDTHYQGSWEDVYIDMIGIKES